MMAETQAYTNFFLSELNKAFLFEIVLPISIILYLATFHIVKCELRTPIVMYVFIYIILALQLSMVKFRSCKFTICWTES